MQPTAPYPYPPAPKRLPTRRYPWHYTAAAAGLSLVLGIAAMALLQRATATPTAAAEPAPTVTVTAVATITAPAPAPVTPHTTAPTTHPPAPKPTIGDGYSAVIPTDAPPGRYDAHSQSTDCYWEIDKTGTGDIVDNDVGKLGHLVVTLKAGETFSSESCGVWTKE